MLWKVADNWFRKRRNFRRCRMKSMRFAGGVRKRCIGWQFRNSPLDEFFYEFGDPSLKFHGFVEIDDENFQYLSVSVNGFDEVAEICDVFEKYSDKVAGEPSTTPWKAELLEKGRKLMEKFRDRNDEP